MANNNLWLSKMTQCKSITQAMSSNYPTIGSIARETTEEDAETFLILELAKLNKRLNLKNPLTEADFEFIASELLTGMYRSLNIGDIALICDNICRGLYGEFYERMNSAKFLTIVREYMNERMSQAEQKSINKANELRKANNLSDISIKALTQMFKNGRILTQKKEDEQRQRRQEEIAARNEYMRKKYNQNNNEDEMF